jgi:hypothetical protein
MYHIRFFWYNHFTTFVAIEVWLISRIVLVFPCKFANYESSISMDVLWEQEVYKVLHSLWSVHQSILFCVHTITVCYSTSYQDGKKS